jgi:hypothetical protein
VSAFLQVYASPYQPEFCDWAFPYHRNQDRYNPPHQSTPYSIPIAENPVPDFPEIDIMMTHGPPWGIRDETSRDEHVGCQHLLRAAHRCRPRLHCFGHIHEAWGAERITWKEGTELDADWQTHVESTEWIAVQGTPFDREHSADTEINRAAIVDIGGSSDRPLEFGRQTLMVNASIMSQTYKPWQSPWLIDLDLERA